MSPRTGAVVHGSRGETGEQVATGERRERGRGEQSTRRRVTARG